MTLSSTSSCLFLVALTILLSHNWTSFKAPTSDIAIYQLLCCPCTFAICSHVVYNVTHMLHIMCSMCVTCVTFDTYATHRYQQYGFMGLELQTSWYVNLWGWSLIRKSSTLRKRKLNFTSSTVLHNYNCYWHFWCITALIKSDSPTDFVEWVGEPD